MVREDSASLLTEAELAKNETSTELRSKLNNSISTLSGLDQRIFDIEQNVANAEFQINLVEYGKFWLGFTSASEKYHCPSPGCMRPVLAVYR